MLPDQSTAVPRHVQTTRADTTHGEGQVLVRRRYPDVVVRTRRHAGVALRRGRPVAWLTLVLYGLAVRAPKGVSGTTGVVAALMAISADFASGRRARPGRRNTAELVNVVERTVERQWRLIEALGVLKVVALGAHLDVAQREASAVCEQGEDCPGPETCSMGPECPVEMRWRDRREWDLVLPAWAADIPVEDGELLAQCQARAVQLIEAMTAAVRHRHPGKRRGPGKPSTPLPVPVEPTCTPAQPVACTGSTGPAWPLDNRPAGRSTRYRRVAPSVPGLLLCLYVQGLNQFSYRPKADYSRPGGRVQGGAAPRHSSTRTKRGAAVRRRRPQMPVAALQLARELLDQGNLPFLTLAPWPMLVTALARFAGAGWTARDVEEAVVAKLAADDRTLMANPGKPVAYLTRYLLAGVDPDQPPAQHREAALAAARVESQAARSREAARRDRDHQAHGGRGHQATRQTARAAAERATARAAAEQAQAAARAAAAAALATSRPDALCAGGCGTLSADVEIRTAMPRPVALCSPCWASIWRALS